MGSPENGVEQIRVQVTTVSHISQIGKLGAELIGDFLRLCQEILDRFICRCAVIAHG